MKTSVGSKVLSPKPTVPLPQFFCRKSIKDFKKSRKRRNRDEHARSSEIVTRVREYPRRGVVSFLLCGFLFQALKAMNDVGELFV